MSDVTRILGAIERDEPAKAGQLLPLVYDEMRKLAARKLAQEKPGQTLQATALVHGPRPRGVSYGNRAERQKLSTNHDTTPRCDSDVTGRRGGGAQPAA